MDERSEARCSCSWNAESSSERHVSGSPVSTLRDLVPGRMRRIEAAAAGGECFKGEEGVDDGVDDGAIWTSVNGGGEGRRGEVEEAMM
jgi:hypothetical protein